MANGDGRGYAIPNPVDPGALVCFRVYVPKHSWYLGAFWLAYEYFTKWWAWARDPLRRGNTAAAVWRRAFDKARAEYHPENGCEMNITDIRLNPLNPCVLQVEYDGNQVWVDKADLSNCGGGCGGSGHGVIQFDGETVNQWDDCLQQWTPVAPGFNPSTQGEYVSKYDDSSGACNGAANIAAWIANMADSQLQLMADGAFIGQLGTLLVQSLLINVGINAFLSSVVDLFLAEFTEDHTVLGDAAALDITTEFTQILYRYMDTDGTIREPKFTACVADLYARRDEETPSTAERIRWGHMTNLLSLAGPFIASRNNKWAGITDADCDAFEWQYVFDFAVGKQDWYGVEFGYSPMATTWQSGEGWKVGLASGAGSNHINALGIKRVFRPTTLTHVHFTYDAVVGDVGTPPGYAEVALSEDVGEDMGEDFTQTGTNKTFAWNGSQEFTSLFCMLFSAYHIGGTLIDAGSGTLKSVTVRGTGENPFI